MFSPAHTVHRSDLLKFHIFNLKLILGKTKKRADGAREQHGAAEGDAEFTTLDNQ